MGKIKDIINEVKQQQEGLDKPRKTKNDELYYNTLEALCADEDYVAKHVKKINDGEIVTEDRHLSKSFRKLLAQIIKKATNMTADEAYEKAKEFKLTREQAETLDAIVKETIYISTKECKKKVNLFAKPDINVDLTIEETPESIRPNPRDPQKKVRIKKRLRLTAKHNLYDYQKETI
jgi:hypothetical protein